MKKGAEEVPGSDDPDYEISVLTGLVHKGYIEHLPFEKPWRERHISARVCRPYWASIYENYAPGSDDHV